ncbi:MAG TPA: molybdopterin cofactor-binding domain-containing protein, partial [Geobacterales bacterium]|nr:molybdopterin cofactor-binding domain-containing protein [Geobacterales bacterium]
MTIDMTRRQFLKGASLSIAIIMTPLGYRLVHAEEVGSSDFSPNVWLRLTKDGTVTIIVNKSEMGQGVTTSLPMIIADEMEAEWNSIRFEMAPARDAYRDPIWGAQATGGSSSIRHMYAPLRKAGAAARSMLITAAASEWQVPASDCEAKLGKVIHRPSNRGLTFGELVDTASRLPVPAEPPL